MTKGAFLPTFGNRPAHIVGRSSIARSFVDALSEPVGHPVRSSLIIGQRGTGKTTLLKEFEALARQKNFVPALVTANEDMLDDIIEAIQKNGAHYFASKRPEISGFTLGVAGLALGLTFEREVEDRLSFRFKLEMLCDALAEQDKGVLILVDEVQPNTSQIRSLAVNYQHLVGDNKNIALVMAGLPTSVSAVLHDDILTFLNRAHKIRLDPIPLSEIKEAYATEFMKQGKEISPGNLEQLATASMGYPYMYQLIGFYTLTRLIAAEVIAPAGHGKLSIIVPYLGEYLRSKF